jgi:hypothetical protein
MEHMTLEVSHANLVPIIAHNAQVLQHAQHAQLDMKSRLPQNFARLIVKKAST